MLDDEKNIRGAIEIALSQEGIHVIGAHDVAAALRALHERIVDAMIVDIRLGEVGGLEFFRRASADGIAPPTIFISGHASLTEAAQAVKVGGFDFLEKPFTAEKIAVTVKRCLEMSSLRERLRLAQSQRGGGEIVGDSAAIRKVVAAAMKVARDQCHRTDHRRKRRGQGAGGQLHPRAQRARQRTFRQGELLGDFREPRGKRAVRSRARCVHRRGGFEKRVVRDRARGVIFLDEIADLAASAQAKILRVLQNGEIQRVGSERVTTVDVRILSGTHKDLKVAVAEGRFREDLFYRLNVVPIRVPALRERKEDIPLLVRFLMRSLSERNNMREKPIDDEVIEELKRHDWPGNVRELQNLLERLMIMSGERITTFDLPEEFLALPERGGAAGSSLKEYRDHAEREYIVATLRRHNGNVSQAAIELGVGRTYLHRRLAVLQITKKDFLA